MARAISTISALSPSLTLHTGAPTKLVSSIVTRAEPPPSAIQSNTNIPDEIDISDQNSAPRPTPPTANSPSIDNIFPSLPEQINNTNLKQKRKLSFSLPFIKAGGAIRDVGVDVLRGVSSMSNSGVVGSF